MEVGQRIDVYEVLKTACYDDNVSIGNHLVNNYGQKSYGWYIPLIHSKSKVLTEDGNVLLSPISECKKVGTLIIKSIK